jgi:hypothetical protein
LQQVKQKEQADIGSSARFNLVQGDYYEKLVADRSSAMLMIRH